MKKVLLPLVGAGIFLLDESLKNYAKPELSGFLLLSEKLCRREFAAGNREKADRQDRASEST